MKAEKSQTSINIIVGILLIFGGIAYILNFNGLGLVLASIGLLIEAIVNWVIKW